MEKQVTIGAFLQKGREAKNTSLEEIADKTKININVLRSIEEDNLDNLPNKTYVKGFVKNYAKTVGLSSEEASLILEETYKLQYPQEETLIEEPVAPSEEAADIQVNQFELQEKLVNFVHKLFTKKVILSTISVVVLVFVIKGIIGFIGTLNNEQKAFTETNEETTQPVENSKDIKSADKPLFDLDKSKELQAEAAEKIEEKKEVVAAKAVPEKKEETPKIEEPKKEKEAPKKKIMVNGQYPFIKFSKPPGHLYDIVSNAPEANDEEILPANIKNSMIPDMHNVYIRAVSGDTWLSYQVDDGKITRYVLKEGRSVLLKGDVILLFLGNLNVTKIFYNNQLVNAYSRTGVKSLIFPQEKASDYELPLFPTFNGVPVKADEYKENMAQAATE